MIKLNIHRFYCKNSNLIAIEQPIILYKFDLNQHL